MPVMKEAKDSVGSLNQKGMQMKMLRAKAIRMPPMILSRIVLGFGIWDPGEDSNLVGTIRSGKNGKTGTAGA
jgi:hypothetical protein